MNADVPIKHVDTSTDILKDTAVGEEQQSTIIRTENVDNTIMAKKILSSFPSILNIKSTEVLIERLRLEEPLKHCVT